METTHVLCIIWCFITFCTATKVNYSGHKVIRFIPHNEDQFKYVQKFQFNPGKVDIWRGSAGIGIPLDLSGNEDELRTVIGSFERFGMNPGVLMNDLQEGIDYQLETNKGSGDANADFDYGKYHTLEEIQGWVEDITKRYPNIADMVSIVKSYEGREMLAIQIRSDSSSNKAGIWIEGGIHAREWISPATVIYMAGKLLEGYGEVENVTKAIDAFDWYIVPVVNVDGYKYTWTGDRNWRKTRTKHLLCYGSDPNRNWDNHWCNGESAGGHNPCSDVYCGPKPFSEPVVKGVADFILSKPTGYFKIFIDFHSYSQLWMSPWGYTKAKPKDYEQQEASSAATVQALTAVHGTKYIYGPIASTIYVASGSSADWTYANASIKYSYGVELRDQGQYGFLLPADQIIPSGEETLQGLLTLTQFVQNNP